MKFFDFLFRKHPEIIIGGMPKSGTTVVAALISAATQKKLTSDPFFLLDKTGVEFRGELFDGHLNIEGLFKKYPKIFMRSEVIKDPNFPLFYRSLMALVQDVKIVSVIRDPRDNIRSILNRLDLPGKGEAGFSSIPNTIPLAWKNLLTGRNPDVHGSNYIEILSRRWVMTAEKIDEYSSFGAVIKYEDFVKSKEAEIYRILDALGVKKRRSIIDKVNIQYQPAGNSRITPQEFFDKNNLKMINAICGAKMEIFGYE